MVDYVSARDSRRESRSYVVLVVTVGKSDSHRVLNFHLSCHASATSMWSHSTPHRPRSQAALVRIVRVMSYTSIDERQPLLTRSRGGGYPHAAAGPDGHSTMSRRFNLLRRAALPLLLLAAACVAAAVVATTRSNAVATTRSDAVAATLAGADAVMRSDVVAVLPAASALGQQAQNSSITFTAGTAYTRPHISAQRKRFLVGQGVFTGCLRVI